MTLDDLELYNSNYPGISPDFVDLRANNS